MIRVTKLNGEVFYVNPYEIEFIEETPDTVISLKSGKKVLVSEKADKVIHEMIEFYRLTSSVHRKNVPEDLIENETGNLDNDEDTLNPADPEDEEPFEHSQDGYGQQDD